MTELADGTQSVLGVEGAEHDRLRKAIWGVMDLEDLPKIAEWSRGYAESLLDASGGTIDVVTDLITRTATETCCRYFGLSVNDPVAFAHWSIAVSSLLFADPLGDPETRKLALNGAARMRAVLEDAVARVHGNNRIGEASDSEGDAGSRKVRETLVDRLMDPSLTGTALADAEVVATLMGMAAGFIPTNTLAAGNMLEELLADSDLMKRARCAALRGAGDEKALEKVLLEAARRNPALSPGQWRHVVSPATIAKDTGRARTVKPGDLVMVAIASALRDSRTKPWSPEQTAQLVFGVGHHSCLGKLVAMKQIVQVFMALLRRKDLRVASGRHGWMQRMGVFPIRLDMTFASPTSTQSMIIVSVPVKDGALVPDIEREIDALDARNDVTKSLTASEMVHFASLSVIPGDAGGDSGGIILLEINADGPRDQVFRILADGCCDWLGPVLAHGRKHGRPFERDSELEAFLERKALDLHCYPWGPIGIHYNGTPEFSVKDIARQHELAGVARNALDEFFRGHLGTGSRSMEALVRVRRLAKQDSFFESNDTRGKIAGGFQTLRILAGSAQPQGPRTGRMEDAGIPIRSARRLPRLSRRHKDPGRLRARFPGRGRRPDLPGGAALADRRRRWQRRGAQFAPASRRADRRAARRNPSGLDRHRPLHARALAARTHRRVRRSGAGFRTCAADCGERRSAGLRTESHYRGDAS